MAVAFTRITLVRETAINLYIVSDDETFVVGIDASAYPNHNRLFACFEILVQFCSSFYGILQTADVLLVSIVRNRIILRPVTVFITVAGILSPEIAVGIYLRTILTSCLAIICIVNSGAKQRIVTLLYIEQVVVSWYILVAHGIADDSFVP